jgi:hypothetical protein
MEFVKRTGTDSNKMGIQNTAISKANARGVGIPHMSNIRQTSVTAQRLLEDISVVTHKRENKGTARSGVAFSVRQKVRKEDKTRKE